MGRRVLVYESWGTSEVIRHDYEFRYWTDDVVTQIDRQLEFLGVGPLRPALDAELTEKEKEIEWYENNRAEHIRFIETVLGRTHSEQATEEALKRHAFYAYDPITTA